MIFKAGLMLHIAFAVQIYVQSLHYGVSPDGPLFIPGPAVTVLNNHIIFLIGTAGPEINSGHRGHNVGFICKFVFRIVEILHLTPQRVLFHHHHDDRQMIYLLQILAGAMLLYRQKFHTGPIPIL